MVVKNYRAGFQYEESGHPETELFQFDEMDLTVLHRYVEYYDEMIQLGINPAEMMIEVSIRIDLEQRQTQVSSEKPHPLVLSGFANAIRPFILEKEPTAFHRVLGVVRNSCSSCHFREFTRRLANAYKYRNYGMKFTLRAGQEIISQDRAFNLWLNSYIYHRDPDKRALLESFKTAAPWEMQESCYQMLFIEKARIIQILALTIKHVFKNAVEAIMMVFPGAAVVNKDL